MDREEKAAETTSVKTASKRKEKDSSGDGSDDDRGDDGSDRGNNVSDDDDGDGSGSSGATKSPAELFLQALDLPVARFMREYRKNIQSMGQFPYGLEDRIAPNIGHRLLVMSGLTWNEDSQNRKRDWSNIAIAATLEMALIESYRADLLACPGASALRGSFKECFGEWAVQRLRTNALSQRELINEWSFADGIEVLESASTSNGKAKAYDPDKVVEEMAVAHLAGLGLDLSEIIPFVRYAEKCKYLACSEPGVRNGTIETLAHYYISGLIQVPLYGRCFQPAMPHRFTPSFQIICVNMAISTHKKLEGAGHGRRTAQFNKSLVKIPSIKRKPHAVSKAYYELVSA